MIAAACSSVADPKVAPASSTSTAVVVAATAEPTAIASSEPAPEATAEPGPPPPPKPEGSTYLDLVDAPGDARLDAAAEARKGGEAKRARQMLSKVVSEIDVNGTLDVKMAAHALLGRACQSTGDAKCAAAHYQTVRDLWKDPETAKKAVESAGSDDKDKMKRLARALNAEGEALFYVAEEKRLLAEKAKMPEYTGPGKLDSVATHLRTKVAPWIAERRKRIDDAEKAYVAILQIQPVPPPRWVISAGARVGDMYARFVAQFRQTPVPADWKKDGTIPGTTMTYEELRKEYYTRVDEAAEPYRRQAIGAFKKCQEMSKKYQYSDALSKQCDDWLARNAPSTP